MSLRRKRTSAGDLIISTDAQARTHAEKHLVNNNFATFKWVTTSKKNGVWFVNFSGFCPLHKREHKGNHFYVIVPSSVEKPMKFACHDEDEGGVFLPRIITEDDLKCGIRNPLPNFNSEKAFEWDAFLHLVRIGRTECKSGYNAASDYLNGYAVHLEKDDKVLLHYAKRKFTLNDPKDFDVDLDKWWQNRTVLKEIRCDAPRLPFMKDFVWHLPNNIELWHNLDLTDLDRRPINHHIHVPIDMNE